MLPIAIPLVLMSSSWPLPSLIYPLLPPLLASSKEGFVSTPFTSSLTIPSLLSSATLILSLPSYYKTQNYFLVFPFLLSRSSFFINLFSSTPPFFSISSLSTFSYPPFPFLLPAPHPPFLTLY